MGQPVQIPWPTSAWPGRRPGEGQGDLVNLFASPEGEEVKIRRVGGLVPSIVVSPSTGRTPRGILGTANVLVHVWDGSVYTKNLAGITAATTGVTVTGSDPVTLAANLRPTGTDVVIVSANAAYHLDVATGIVTSYPDGDLGAVTTVEYYAGYFIFTRTSGEMIASGLQSTSIDPLSFARAEYSDDFLRRVKNNGSVLLAFGDKTTEIWTDVGASPWPLARQNAINVGIFGMWSVAGGANEWEHGVMFVAGDYTVRVIDGYGAPIVSNEAVSRDIFDYRNTPDEVKCFTYAFGQYSIFCIRTPTWTWEYCVNTGKWHRRTSYNRPTWRGLYGAFWNRRWFVMDTVKGQVCEVDLDVQTEDGERIIGMVESGPLKDFPASMRIPSIDVDIVAGVGTSTGTDLDPSVLISWSTDGGGAWSNPVVRSMGKPGEYAKRVSVRNIGRTNHNGLRLRLELPDPVFITITGAISTRTQGSRPRQVS
jgi:hypothetical protein